MISARPRTVLVIVGLVAYLGFLVATVPAGWLAYGVNRVSAHRVLLLNPRGTIWSGDADLVVKHGAPEPVYLGTLRWRLSAWRLLTLRVAARLRLNNGDTLARATVNLKRRALTLSRVHAELDAAALAPLIGPLSMLGIGGRLVVQAPLLTLAPKRLKGSARIEWNRVTAASLGGKPVGSYRADVRAAGNNLQMSVASATGALRVQGSGTWSPFTTGIASFNGTVESTDARRFPPQMLAFLGQDAGGGRRRVHYQGRWRIPWSAPAGTAVSTQAAAGGPR